MTNLVEQVNRLYLNAAEAVAVPKSWKIDFYSSPKGTELATQLAELRRWSFDLQDTTFSNLAIALNVIKTYSRCLLTGEPMDDFWTNELSALESEIFATRNYLPASQLAALEQLLSFLRQNIEEIAQLHSESIRSAVDAVDGRVLLVPETARLRHKADDWVATQGLSDKVTVHSLRDVRIQLFEPFELTLFPSSPSAYLNREQFASHLRALLLTGVTPKATFVSPDWFMFKRDIQLDRHLMPGFELANLPPLEISIPPQMDISMVPEAPAPSDVFEDWIPRHASGDYATYETGGNQACRVIAIGEELGFPVEADSKKVSVFEFNEKADAWQILFKNPFKELKPGDYLVACVDRSESQALLERAAKDMGDDFERYVSSQIHWKSLLQEKIAQLGISTVEAELKGAGVEKYSRARNWVDEEHMDPLLNRDFEVLLHWLGLGKSEAKLTLELAKSMDGARIQAGRNAGNAISQSLDEQELMALEKGLVLEVTLEDHGDATYLLAPVLGVGDDLILFRSSQVRRVVAGKFEVE